MKINRRNAGIYHFNLGMYHGKLMMLQEELCGYNPKTANDSDLKECIFELEKIIKKHTDGYEDEAFKMYKSLSKKCDLIKDFYTEQQGDNK